MKLLKIFNLDNNRQLVVIREQFNDNRPGLTFCLYSYMFVGKITLGFLENEVRDKRFNLLQEQEADELYNYFKYQINNDNTTALARNKKTMKTKQLRQKQDQKRRENLAYAELAEVGGYLDHAVKLISLQYLVGSMVQVLATDIEITLERANLNNTKLISIQNGLEKATTDYFKFFENSIKDEAVIHWANDLERLEKVVYEFGNIKTLRPKRKAMSEAKEVIEKRFNVKMEDLK